MTYADRITLARLLLAPLAAAAYLVLPVQWALCFWACGLICGLAEATDYFDGMVARARGEVSDFGKLADPFCDVFYRLTIFLVFLLPAGGTGIAVATASGSWPGLITPPVYHLGTDADGAAILGAGLVPWIPVWLMVMREIVAGALRAMAATKGLVLAARNSGKFKAWLQGTTIITACAIPALFGGPGLRWLFAEDPGFYLPIVGLLTWLCAAASVISMAEYIWVNRPVLRQLIARKPMDPVDN